MTPKELLDEAWAAFEARKFDEALTAVEKAIEASPEDATAWLAKGNILVAREEHRGALEALDKSIEHSSGVASTWFQKGLAHQNLDEVPQAIDAYKKATELDPDHSLAWRRLGLCLAETGQYPSALRAIKKALELNPDWGRDADALSILCTALNETGDPKEALKTIDEASKSDPKLLENPFLRFQEGFARNMLGEHEKALEALEKAEGCAPVPPLLGLVRLQQGLARQALGDHAEATRAFEEALDLSPPGALRGFVWLHKGRSHVALNDRSAANEDLKHAKDEPGPLPTLFFLDRAILLNMLGRYDEALADLEQVIKDNPQLIQAWDQKAGALVRLGRFPEAMQAVEKSIELAPEGPQKTLLWFGKAAVLIKKGDFEAALAALDEVSRRDSTAEKGDAFLDAKVRVLLALDKREQVQELLQRVAQDSEVAGTLVFQVLWAFSLLLLGKDREAREKLEAIDAEEPAAAANAAVWLTFGIVRSTLGRFRKALEALGHARELDPSVQGNPQYLTAQTLALSGVGRNEEALAAADRLVQLDPADLLAHLHRGIALVGFERHNEALREFDRVLELCPASPLPKLFESAALIHKGRVWLAMKQQEEALTAFRRAALLSEEARSLPNRVAALCLQGLALYSRSTKEGPAQAKASRTEALEVTSRAAELSRDLSGGPLPELAWWSKGNVLTWLERDEEALIAYRTASECKSDSPHVRMSLGEAYERLQDPEKAVEAFTKATKIAVLPGEESEAWLGKGRSLLRLQRYDEAIEACRSAVAASGENESVLELLGKAYSALGRHDAALLTFRRGWALGKPNKRSAALALGVSAELLAQGRDAEARSFLEGAEKETRFNGRLYHNLGTALYRLKSFGSAARALRKAAKMGVPGDGEYADQLEGGGAQSPSWLAFWFGPAMWLRKALGSILLLLLVVALLPTLLKPDALPFLPWLDMSKDWKLVLVPIVLAAALLVMPILKRFKFGDTEIDVSQPEPQVGRPDLDAALKAFSEAAPAPGLLMAPRRPDSEP